MLDDEHKNRPAASLKVGDIVTPVHPEREIEGWKFVVTGVYWSYDDYGYYVSAEPTKEFSNTGKPRLTRPERMFNRE